jgi:hypothetical protein
MSDVGDWLFVIGFFTLVIVGIGALVVVGGGNLINRTIRVDNQNVNATYYTFAIPQYQNADRVEFDVHSNEGFPIVQTIYVNQRVGTVQWPCNATFYTKDANMTVTLSVDYFQSIDGLYTNVCHKDYLIDLKTVDSTSEVK